MPTNLPEHPLVDGHYLVRLLGQGQEGIGELQALLWVLPAQQGFEAHHAPVSQGDDGLVVEHELPLLHGPPELGLQL